jgi:hypothetical protein
MAKFIRYALATVFFAASVGCLALWGWNFARREMLDGAGLVVASTELEVEVYQGIAAVWASTTTPNVTKWQVKSVRLQNEARFAGILRQRGRFGAIGPAIFFPLWYPALIFAIAGVAALRFRRQFSIRSALIAVSVAAAWLGMDVAL